MNCNKLLARILIPLSFAVTGSAHAVTEVGNTIPAYWVQANGDHMFYGTAAGPCAGTALYLVKTSLPNFSVLVTALTLAMARGYRVSLVVDGCEGNQNKVTFAKVCANAAYC